MTNIVEYLDLILLFSLALVETYAVLKIPYATMPQALGPHTGSGIFKLPVNLNH
jgi:hypothetical protein